MTLALTCIFFRRPAHLTLSTKTEAQKEKDEQGFVFDELTV